MRALLTVLLLAFAAPVSAQCAGRDLIAALPAAEQADLRALAAAAPFASGNAWRATRDGATITLIGTFHLDDPRHDATLAALTPALDSARILLVEAGPAEEAAVAARLWREPELLFNRTGPTLPEALPKAEWQALADALQARQIPPFLAARARPWFLSALLAIPPCATLSGGKPRGLDARLIEAAEARGLPVQALEPYDTVFTAFERIQKADQLAMIRSALALEPRAEDLLATLTRAYFAGENRLIWEFTRRETARLPGYTLARTDAELAVMDAALISARNRAWIPVIEAAAAEGPVLVAFGALHLPGEAGVPALLEARGFTVQPWPLP